MMNKITPNYADIVDIAQHCDMYKLRIAENNALNYDLQAIICKFEKEIEQANEDDPIFAGGQSGAIFFGGINKIAALYSYARYVEGSVYVDTGSGLVRKTHSNSIPFQVSEVANLANQHRLMAKNEIERLEAYICSLSPDSCACGHSFCAKMKSKKTYAIDNVGRNLRMRNDLLNY